MGGLDRNIIIFWGILDFIMFVVVFNLGYLEIAVPSALDYLSKGLNKLMRASLWAILRFADMVKLALFFGYFWIDEAIRGPREAEHNNTFWEDNEESHADEDSQAARQAAYEQAVQVLGLPPVFTQAEMIKAYRRAIRAAHPDAGGSTKAAQAVNAARKTILAYRGWA